MARALKTKAARVKSGYVVEEFDLTASGYGNLEEVRLTRMQAIRHFCWSCQGGHELDWRCGDGSVEKKSRPYDEVRACSSTTCYLWPFRTGREVGARAKKRSPHAGA